MRVERGVAIVLSVFLLIAAAAFTWASVVLAPHPNTPSEVFGVVSGLAGLFFGTVVAVITPIVITVEHERKRSQEEKSSEYNLRINKSCGDLISSVGRLTSRIDLALSQDGYSKGQLLAAKDNAQQITNVILQLSQMCGASLEDAKEEIRRVQAEVGETGSILIRDQKEAIADYADIGSVIEAQTEVIRREIQAANHPEGEGVFEKYLASFERVQQEIASKIDSLQTTISKEQDELSGHTAKGLNHTDIREVVSQNCPVCDAPTTFQIGRNPGDSASPICANGHVFHAHRGRQGIFVRKPGGAGSHGIALRRDFRCPNEECSQVIPLTYPEGAENTFLRWCISCGAKCELTPSDGSSRLIAKKPIEEATSTDPLICPVHGVSADIFYKNSQKDVGFCTECDGLVEFRRPPAGILT